MHPLDSVWLKVVRAKEHLDFLNAEVQKFWTLKPCEVITEKNLEVIDVATLKDSKKFFRFKINREPPTEWSAIVGDFAYNLRSALDHLVWQLALLFTSNPRRSTEFPIFDTISSYQNSRSGAKRKLRDVLPASHSIIESLQPYHRRDWPEVEHLWWLHEINRIDKHREIIPNFIQSGISFSDMAGIYRANRLNDDDVISIEMPPKSKLDIYFTAEIAFNVPDMPFPINTQRLDGIHKFIREEVIPRFSSFFPQP